MANLPILYTSTDAVRSALGLDQYDIKDEVMTSRYLDIEQQARLSLFLPDHETVADDETQGPLLKLWAMYFCALIVAEQMQLGIPYKIQANQDQLERFKPMDWEALIARLRAKVRQIEGELNPNLAVALAKQSTWVGTSSPEYDPVVGNAARAQVAPLSWLLKSGQ